MKNLNLFPKSIRDLEWYHLIGAFLLFMFLYQMFFFTVLWGFFNHDIVNRYSWSQADAAGIFAVVTAVWLYHKAKKERRQYLAAEWFTTKVMQRLRERVDNGDIDEKKIDAIIDRFIDHIVGDIKMVSPVSQSELQKAIDEVPEQLVPEEMG